MMLTVLLNGLLLNGLAYSPATNELPDHDAMRKVQVDSINALPGLHWTAGVSSRFAGLPVGASKSLCGVKKSSKAVLDHRVKKGVTVKRSAPPNAVIPEAFDSATQWPQCAEVIGDIRDQSNCGCCWAFGAAEAASDRLCIATNGTVKVALSAQDMCFCTQTDGCDGGFPEMAWERIGAEGIVTGGQSQDNGPFASAGFCASFSLPHCHHHGPTRKDPYPAENTPGCPSVHASPACPSTCDAGAKAPHNSFEKDKYTFSGIVETYEDEAAIQAAIMAAGPVEAAFSVYSDFEHYAGGIYHQTSDEPLGGHAIKIVGWGVDKGVKYWKIANSWNPYWGESGYFRIRRGTNECGIEEQAVANSASFWTGPGIAPPPPAPPAPPHKGSCDFEDSEAECEATTGPKGTCKWCYLSGIGVGICENPDESC